MAAYYKRGVSWPWNKIVFLWFLFSFRLFLPIRKDHFMLRVFISNSNFCFYFKHERNSVCVFFFFFFLILDLKSIINKILLKFHENIAPFLVGYINIDVMLGGKKKIRRTRCVRSKYAQFRGGKWKIFVHRLHFVLIWDILSPFCWLCIYSALLQVYFLKVFLCGGGWVGWFGGSM